MWSKCAPRDPGGREEQAARRRQGGIQEVARCEQGHRGALAGQPPESISPDRRKEFAAHSEIAGRLGVGFCFALSHHPWQRGTNENANGLLREYFPKGAPLERVSDEQIAEVRDKLNRRPRKTLGFKTPYEVHYSASLQLI
ncbi:IS30 family transposase [Ellagibacter isourolithinifaciens]